MDYLNTNALYMPLLTAIGAFSSWPKSNFLAKLGQNELVQWFFVFVLIMQGGAGGNVQLAATMTIVAYVAVKALDMVTASKEGYYN